MKTQQEVFDQVVDHLIKQGVASQHSSAKASGNGCAYRGENGLMCAVGCLIPNKMYHPGMEGISVGLLVDHAQSGYFRIPDELYYYTDLLAALQELHDNCMPRILSRPALDNEWYPSDLKLVLQHLVTIAATYKLNFDATKYQ